LSCTLGFDGDAWPWQGAPRSFFSLNATVVAKVPISGGTKTILATRPSTDVVGKLAVDSANVYWTEQDMGSGGVMSVPLGGGCVSTLVWGNMWPWGIAADDKSVFITAVDGVARIDTGP
jgi:hypothetical protein